MAVQQRFYTADDLWTLSHLPENAARRFELIAGELVETSPTGWLHGDLTLRLSLRIGEHVLGRKLGRVTAAETGYYSLA